MVRLEFSLKTRHRKKIWFMGICIFLALVVLWVNLGQIMIFQSEYYQQRADELHERERAIKASRGRFLDANGVVLASNKTVCTISVIHSQIKDKEAVIEMLCNELGLDREDVKRRVEKVTSIERIKTNVDKEVGDRIREKGLDGVKVDEDYKRYYPYEELASKVLGFTGSDNQGVVGLEVKYDSYLAGKNGKILTLTDSRGIELDGMQENRNEPVAGMDVTLSIDYNIQKYAQQLAQKAYEEKEAKSVSIIVMNPQNGEIMAMVNYPEYNLNEPYVLNYELEDNVTGTAYQDLLNKMWRNKCINDTYEPGSTFKMITATAALETKSVSLESQYFCPGYKIVDDRRIRCAKIQGHGAQDFTHTVMNSCNPAFIEWGLRTGVDQFYEYMGKLGILSKTGIDLPGEASTIMHKKENIGQVELATISFGQSFQITPMQLLRAASAIINGGTLVTPHFAVKATDSEGNNTVVFDYPTIENAINKETSDTMRGILRRVVSEGGGKNAQVEGYDIGGKTATSEKLPRGNGKYISSFVGFAPVENPRVIAMCIIDEPTGIYYGGTISAPVVEKLFENILPYLGIEKTN